MSAPPVKYIIGSRGSGKSHRLRHVLYGQCELERTRAGLIVSDIVEAKGKIRAEQPDQLVDETLLVWDNGSTLKLIYAFDPEGIRPQVITDHNRRNRFDVAGFDDVAVNLSWVKDYAVAALTGELLSVQNRNARRDPAVIDCQIESLANDPEWRRLYCRIRCTKGCTGEEMPLAGHVCQFGTTHQRVPSVTSDPSSPIPGVLGVRCPTPYECEAKARARQALCHCDGYDPSTNLLPGSGTPQDPEFIWEPDCPVHLTDPSEA